MTGAMGMLLSVARPPEPDAIAYVWGLPCVAPKSGLHARPHAIGAQGNHLICRIFCELAGAVGFEPTVHGTKNRCLTTWPRPNCGGVYPRAWSAARQKRDKIGANRMACHLGDLAGMAE